MKKITIIISLLAALALVASPVRAAVYNFQLDPPNTAEDPSAGNVIRISGGGQFDTISGIVNAHGSFTKFNPGGKAIARGNWTATDFLSFTTNGGPSPGFQTGKLEINVTLFDRRPGSGAPLTTDVLMTVCCDLSALGFVGPCGEHIEGTSVGEFTEMTGGLNLFNLQVGR